MRSCVYCYVCAFFSDENLCCCYLCVRVFEGGMMMISAVQTHCKKAFTPLTIRWSFFFCSFWACHVWCLPQLDSAHRKRLQSRRLHTCIHTYIHTLIYIQKKSDAKVKDCDKDDNWTCITFKVRALSILDLKISQSRIMQMHMYVCMYVTISGPV